MRNIGWKQNNERPVNSFSFSRPLLSVCAISSIPFTSINNVPFRPLNQMDSRKPPHFLYHLFFNVFHHEYHFTNSIKMVFDIWNFWMKLYISSGSDVLAFHYWTLLCLEKYLIIHWTTSFISWRPSSKSIIMWAWFDIIPSDTGITESYILTELATEKNQMFCKKYCWD